MGLRVLAPAKTDFKEITAFIASRNPRAALKWASEIDAKFSRLGEMPGMGAPRFDVMPGLRIVPCGSYLILYRHEGGDAVILRVVHGARVWERLVGS